LERGGWTRHLSGAEICKTYPSENFPGLIGSSVATPVSRSARPVADWEKTTLVICGRSYAAKLTLFDLLESSSRMYLGISRSACVEFFETWESVVSAVRSDSLQRRKLAHHTDASESSSSAWPTPTASESRDQGTNWKSLREKDKGGRVLRRIASLSYNGRLDPPNRSKTENHRGLLNPEWVEMLMGFPINWTGSDRSETLS